MSLLAAGVGDNCIDRYLPPIARSMVGGNAVNVAVRMKQLGVDSAYFGAVGDDTDGQRIIECLEAVGLARATVRTIPEGRTAFTVVATDPAGDRQFLEEEFGVCRGYRPNANDMAALQRMSHVHIGWLDDGGALKRDLIAAGIAVSQDLSVNADPRNLDPHGLTIAFASSPSPSSRDAQSLLERLLAAGVRTAVVMRGERGAIASEGRDVATTDTKPVAVLDTTGAGDSFIAGFIAARLRQHDLAACLQSGRDAAAETCQHLGGFRQEPMPYP